MKNNITKIISTGVVLGIFVVAMLILTHTAKSGYENQTMTPAVADTPVYVVCEEGKELEIQLRAKRDMAVSGMELLLVNTSADGEGMLHFQVTTQAGELLQEIDFEEGQIRVGSWCFIPVELYLEQDKTYVISIIAKDCEPYFMQTSLSEIERTLQIEEHVYFEQQLLESGVSLGLASPVYVAKTFGDIFYFSIPIVCVFTIIAILLVWLEFGKIQKFLKAFADKRFFERFGSDLILILLFVASCFSIYVQAIGKSVYITSDSAGYLREAVNMAHGNGFSYDGIAGYRSWFANWPIIYPAMIALIMVITSLDAYLASKIVSTILIAMILIVFRIMDKKHAWMYGLVFVNLGFVELTYYTWSELPFMLFMLLFGLFFSKVLRSSSIRIRDYILTGIFALACFLTRYFGIYVYFVMGGYLCVMLWDVLKKEGTHFSVSNEKWEKIIITAVTAFLSGICGVGYLFMNRIMNGMASGVSRKMWWDDYEYLTNDLVQSLLTEFFNAFGVSIPQRIDTLTYGLKAILLIVVSIVIACVIMKYFDLYSLPTVFVVMAVIYDGMFIVIRYFSSMDTFYFRFFEPASFLLTIGLIGMLVPVLDGKIGMKYLQAVFGVILVLFICSQCMESSLIPNGGRNDATQMTQLYYHTLLEEWDKAYEEIPEKSVIIFNGNDYRSAYYRPDIVDGMIYPADTMDSLRATYYGSDFMCILTQDAQIMVEDGSYDISIMDAMEKQLDQGAEGKYIVIPLK